MNILNDIPHMRPHSNLLNVPGPAPAAGKTTDLECVFMSGADFAIH